MRKIAKKDSGWKHKASDFNALGGRQVTGDTLRHRWVRIMEKETSVVTSKADCPACKVRSHLPPAIIFESFWAHRA